MATPGPRWSRITHRTLRERIVDSLKEAIVRGRLRPGERVAEPEVARRFGISRTPVREAFRQLESEGFLTFTPRKGAVVTPITAKDVREFYAVKGLLEGYAARLACPRMTPRDLERLKELNAQMAQAAQAEDVKGFFELDNQFHQVFHRVSGNSKLMHLIHTLVQHYVHFRIAALSVPGRMNTSVRQHEAIIRAFKKRDADRVERLVRDNAEQGCESLVRKIEEMEG